MCTDFIILKGLYIKKKTNKEKKKQGKEFTNLSNASVTHSHVYDTAQIRKTDFVFWSRPDERGRLSKHPNTRDIRRHSRCQILSEGYQEVL